MALTGISLSFGLSKLIPLRSTRLRRLLRGLTWIYLIGWAGAVLLSLPGPLIRAWAAFGWLVFFGLSADWFTQAPGRMSASLPSGLAFEFYVLTLNLSLTSSILLA